GTHANQKVHALTCNLCPQGVAHKACITAKERVYWEYSLTEHVHHVSPFTGVRGPQLPHPGQAEGHLPKQGDPCLRLLGLWFAFLVLSSSHAFRFLLPVLGRCAMAIVGCAEGLLVGLRSGGRTARAVESNGHPTISRPQSPGDFLHPLMQEWPQHGQERICPLHEGSHEPLVGRERRVASHELAPFHSLGKGVRHVSALRPRPAQRQPDEAGWQPTGIAMKLKVRKNPLVREQPPLQL